MPRVTAFPPSMWQLIKSQKVSGITTITINVPTVDWILISFQVTGDGNGIDFICLRVNADAGNNYITWYTLGTAIKAPAAAAQMALAETGTGSNRVDAVGEILVQGRNIINDRQVTGKATSGTGLNANVFLGGYHISTANITSVTILSANATNFSGKIDVWGRNIA
jgi:hypothetical protein